MLRHLLLLVVIPVSIAIHTPPNTHLAVTMPPYLEQQCNTTANGVCAVTFNVTKELADSHLFSFQIWDIQPDGQRVIHEAVYPLTVPAVGSKPAKRRAIGHAK